MLDAEFMGQVERLSLVARSTIIGQVRGERRSKKRGYSNEFADYRDYVAGDDLRYLDWNIYGRLERLFVKLFHEEEDLTVAILVDVSQSMNQGEPGKLRYALQVAAALGYIGLMSEDRVGIYPFAEELRQPFSPVRGRRNAARMFRYLEQQLANPGGVTDLHASLRTFSHTFRGRGMVILISDLLDPAGFDEPLRAIAGRRLDSFLVHLLSPQEEQPPVTGDLRLVDCETSATCDLSVNRRLLEVYEETVQRFREGVAQACSRRNIAPLFTTTATPFQHLVLGYLRSRGLVR
ncbi:MAG: DUF58 domain-containing protein [Planctomycetota bacterium]